MFSVIKRVVFSLSLFIALLVNSITAKASPVGGCVQISTAPYSGHMLEQIGKIKQTKSYAPFNKIQQSYGIKLIAADEINNNFMQQVSLTIKDMFRPTQFIDQLQQAKLLENLYRYRATIPLFDGEPNMTNRQEQQLEQLLQVNSICDIIMANVGDGQVMEVVEHILHIITDVGMHYTFPAQWSLSKDSELYQSMQVAIKKGYYNIDSYDDIDQPLEKERILLQEYAYWLISTAWDLQRSYGPDEDEWLIKSPQELQQKLPMAYRLYQKTVAKVLTRPKINTLEVFNKQ